MENIDIQTSQNVAIEQPIASVGERIAATLIDLIFVGTYTILVGSLGSFKDAPLGTLLFMIPALFYHLVSESVMNGQSWGKKIMKIKVVKIDGTQPVFSTYLIRWIFRLVDVLFLFGAISTIVIIVNGKGQRLGDIVASTTVIRIKEKIFEAGVFTTLPDNYSLKYPQVSKLSDSDISTAREVLNFMKDSSYGADSREMAEKARKAIELKMGIQSEWSSEKFLKIVIYDYNFIHSR